MSVQPSARTSRSAGSEAPAAPSGRLLLRMPSELHAELARAAEREGTSLNQFITRTLSGAVGLDGAEHPQAPGDPAARRRDVTTIVLVANAVAVGLAALAAVAILLVAWQS